MIRKTGNTLEGGLGHTVHDWTVTKSKNTERQYTVSRVSGRLCVEKLFWKNM